MTMPDTPTTILVDPKNPSGWKYRRLAVFATLLFCAGLIGFVVIAGKNDELGRLVVMTLSGLAGSTLGSYVFGAAWERTKGLP